MNEKDNECNIVSILKEQLKLMRLRAIRAENAAVSLCRDCQWPGAEKQCSRHEGWGGHVK